LNGEVTLGLSRAVGPDALKIFDAGSTHGSSTAAGSFVGSSVGNDMLHTMRQFRRPTYLWHIGSPHSLPPFAENHKSAAAEGDLDC
jgi:hypothetical protein